MNAIRLPQLAALGLKIAQTVQIIRHTPLPSKHYTQLIGFVENEFIILRIPKANGWPVHFNEGERLTVRAFSGTLLHEFESHLIAFLHHPRNYMTLGCPDSIGSVPLRSHERVRCALPVRVVSNSIGRRPLEGYRFQDLSGSGAAVVGEAPLGAVGESLQVEVALPRASKTDETVALDAVIQSVKPLSKPLSETAGFLHGIRFQHVDARILRLIHELLHPGRV
jgi:hypothetical protein